jgi:hypothetical protein
LVTGAKKMNKIQILKADIFRNDGMLRKEERYSRVWLKHIPIMINDKGNIVCIPYSEETAHAGIVGQTGKGKGICGHSLLGMQYWFARRPCVVLNDFQQETFENSMPCNNAVFNNNLKTIGLNPMALPMVYVYPSSKDLKIKPVESMFPHIKMCLPTEVVIKNIEDFYKLDKSGKYVTGYIEEFLKCENLADIDSTIDAILEENFPPEPGKTNNKKFEEMKFKIRTIFKNIFDEQISDTAAPADAYSYVTVNKRGLINYKNLTIQGIMASGLIPSIQTSDIKNERWFSAYMGFIVNSIYWDKYNDDYFKNKQVCLYVPEIDKMWKTDFGLDKGKIIKKELCLCGTNGRRAGIMLIWDAQNYDAIVDAIRNNTKYLFVGRMNSDEEVRGIKKDYGVTKEVQDWILHLTVEPAKGLFEFVALTTDKFILYNPRDGSIKYTSEPQKGKLITPMSQHKTPGKPLEVAIGLREEKETPVEIRRKTTNQKIKDLIK